MHDESLRSQFVGRNFQDCSQVTSNPESSVELPSTNTRTLVDRPILGLSGLPKYHERA